MSLAKGSIVFLDDSWFLEYHKTMIITVIGKNQITISAKLARALGIKSGSRLNWQQHSRKMSAIAGYVFPSNAHPLHIRTPNNAIAEAASHFGLKGPVYSIFAEHDLMEKVKQEAMLWLSNHPEISAMVAGTPPDQNPWGQ